MYNTETKKTNIDAEKMKSIKENLLEGLDDGWMSILKPFVYSDDFEKIIHQLAEKVNDEKRFTPELKYIFNAFKQTKYEDLRVVIVGQD